MAELKFISSGGSTPSCCGPGKNMAGEARAKGAGPAWIRSFCMTEAGPVPVVSTKLEFSDLWEHLKCRVSGFRNSYVVSPGLYAVGAPDRKSDLLVTANYKLSFDELRRSLDGLNCWLLVLDTKGINVWCAAGKGTFGTAELTGRISSSRLEKVIDHRNIIVPQLGAPGISAYQVKRASGFHVLFGPVRANDIKAYIASGYKAAGPMRTIEFPLRDRLILTPMEINPALKKYYPVFALLMLVFFGLKPEGILFSDAFSGGLPFLGFGLVSIFAGAFATPLLLPALPFRSFALKGWIVGFAATALLKGTIGSSVPSHTALLVFIYLFFPLAGSYIALQFTGSTTFTGMAGVRKELRFALPLYLLGGLASVLLLILFKLQQWGLL